MKKLFTLILMFAAVVVSAQEHLTFKNVPIDGKIEQFISKLNDGGANLTLESQTPTVTTLKGDFAGLSNCTYLILTTRSGLVCKVAVLSDYYDTWRSMKDVYYKYKELYLGKYEKDAAYEFFSKPYYDGDGYEFLALAKEKAHFVTFLKAEGGGITVEIDGVNSLKGRLTFKYEDFTNMKIYSEEKKQTISSEI